MTDSWMIRAGKNGIYVNDFLISGIVAIECSNLGTMTHDVSSDEIARRYKEANPSDTKIQARNTISQINRFVHSISTGDIVLTYEVFLRELNLWEVKDTEYTVNDLVVTTSSKNVVDIANETFRNFPEVYVVDYKE